MLTQQDWASLCREYRATLGLKQEAMAQDFRVDQSTVSRWERGQREPPIAVKQIILNRLLDKGMAGPDSSMQFLLEQSGSAVAIWDRAGRLRGCSRRFERELRQKAGLNQLVLRSGTDLLAGSDILIRALTILEDKGFFDGALSLAVFTFPPFLQEQRVAAGGRITASTFPLRTASGEIMMLCIYDHDTLASPPAEPDGLTVSWVCAGDDHAGSVQTSPVPGSDPLSEPDPTGVHPSDVDLP